MATGLTELQLLQKLYWQDLGTCERIRMQLMHLPNDPLKQDALEYVARAVRIIKETYIKESAILKARSKEVER